MTQHPRTPAEIAAEGPIHIKEGVWAYADRKGITIVSAEPNKIVCVISRRKLEKLLDCLPPHQGGKP